MAAIDLIKRRLKEDRVPEVLDEITEKKKRLQEIAFMDVNLCFPCGKYLEFARALHNNALPGAPLANPMSSS